jgi:serine/threonine protein kinase
MTRHTTSHGNVLGFVEQADGRIIVQTYIPEEQWDIAEFELRNKPTGTKLSCYDYGDFVLFDDPSGGRFSLSHTFIVIGKEVFAISGNNLIKELDLNTGIPRHEWKFAKEQLQNKRDYTKLRHIQKFPKTLPHPKTNCPIQMTHSFIIIDDVIYGYAGASEPRMNLGTTAKIKEAVTQDNRLFALKIPFKLYRQLPRIDALGLFLNNEIQISAEIGFLIAAGIKISNNETHDETHGQRVMVFPLFESDFHDFLLKKIKASQDDHQQKNPLVKKIFLSLFQVIDQLDTLHQKNIIHRDLKPENILITESEDPEIEIVAKIADFGFAVKTSDGSYKSTHCVGTRAYIDPALLHAFERRRDMIYSKATDLYALGMIIKNIFSLMRKKKVLSSSWFADYAASGLTFSDPANRMPLQHAKLFLFCNLYEALSPPKASIESLLKKFNCVISTERALKFIAKRITSYTPSVHHDEWIQAMKSLESDLRSDIPEISDRANNFFTLIEEVVKHSTSDREIAMLFWIYQKNHYSTTDDLIKVCGRIFSSEPLSTMLQGLIAHDFTQIDFNRLPDPHEINPLLRLLGSASVELAHFPALTRPSSLFYDPPTAYFENLRARTAETRAEIERKIPGFPFAPPTSPVATTEQRPSPQAF